LTPIRHLDKLRFRDHHGTAKEKLNRTSLAGLEASTLTPGTYGATISVWAPEALHPVQTISVMVTIAAMAD
jgi:hypothetical protein